MHLRGLASGTNPPSDELFFGLQMWPRLLAPQMEEEKNKSLLSPQLVALPRIWVKLIWSIVSVGGFEFDEL